jgi:hypothetical protein
VADIFGLDGKPVDPTQVQMNPAQTAQMAGGVSPSQLLLTVFEEMRPYEEAGMRVDSVIIVLQTSAGQTIRCGSDGTLRVDTALGQLEMAKDWLMRSLRGLAS